MPKKMTKEAMRKAKELESIPEITRKDIENIKKKESEEIKKIQRLLEPSWFVFDVHKKKKAVKKSKKTAKKKKSKKKSK